MQTRTLRTLVAISRAGSFAGAAAELNMTISAVSMQIKALETELGMALFDRAFRPPRQTPAGRAVAMQALRVLAEEDALLDLCTPHDRLAGRFRLGFVATASVRLLPGFMRRAQGALPEARFVFETGLSQTLESRVAAGGLDAAVVTASTEPGPGIAHRLVRHEPLAFAVDRTLMRKDPRTTLAEAPFLQFRPGTGIGTRVAASTEGLETGPRLILDSVETIMECVRERVGTTLLPRPDIERYGGPETIIFDVRGIAISRRLVLATRAGDTLTDKAHLLTDLMRAA